jgi:2-polyprenyl-6-methoxyphenol hydroxylase-like FAD-dependent oxidoreductase
VRVTAITEIADGVTLSTLDADDKPGVVRSEIVVACDGAGSIVAREAEFPTFGVSHPFRWLASSQRRLRDQGFASDLATGLNGRRPFQSDMTSAAVLHTKNPAVAGGVFALIRK